MRAIRLAAVGGPERLTWVDCPDPIAGAGEVVVRNAAVGVNFIDIYHRTGLYPLPLPTGLGTEAAGSVESVGPGVVSFSPGDRVAYATAPIGAYAERHCVPEGRLVRLPDDIGFDVAAACLLKGMTAEFLLRRVFHVKQGHAILVHAAAGGVGSILTQWAHQLGATVIGVVGSDDKAERARAQGCDHVLVSPADLAARVKDLTNGQGVHVAYDSVGRDTMDGSLASLRRFGLLVSYGNASGAPAPIDPLRLSRGGSLFLTRPTLFDYVADPKDLRDSAEALFDALRAGVQITIGARRPLSEAALAQADLEARRTTGSTVLMA